MPLEDSDRILALLRDPNVDSQQVAAETGLPREEAARAARLLVTLPKARGEDVVTLPLPLAGALLRAALAAGRADLLAEVVAAAGDRAIAKEAKRGLHVLRLEGAAAQLRECEAAGFDLVHEFRHHRRHDPAVERVVTVDGAFLVEFRPACLRIVGGCNEVPDTR
jgi:hypothetical protein